MAQTLVGIVYDGTTKLISMIIVPDDDSQLADPAWLAVQGSTMLQTPIATYAACKTSADIQALVAAVVIAPPA
jgi:hypothetical protein